ncbi:MULTISPECIES: MAPEG family protein [Rhodomicrobium]|uniref:MAPEG family protein n=1 Tax=Rhodomicrobium TaxID=1068 RepID=UPI000B4B22AC|nr:MULTISPECIES: MAPEG family protein [Rhodomicrobium]
MKIAILYPVFAQIILTLVVLTAMGRARSAAFRERQVKHSDVALDSSLYPEDARKLGNCYSNQFELPVIFYVLCLIAQITANADYLMVLLAWAFVISRVLHAYVHTTTNIVLRRGGAFVIGYFIIIAMTALLLLRLLFPNI